jgi:hypothetical protein
MELGTTAQLKLTFNEDEVYELVSWLDKVAASNSRPQSIINLVTGLHGFEDFCNENRM